MREGEDIWLAVQQRPVGYAVWRTRLKSAPDGHSWGFEDFWAGSVRFFAPTLSEMRLKCDIEGPGLGAFELDMAKYSDGCTAKDPLRELASCCTRLFPPDLPASPAAV